MNSNHYHVIETYCENTGCNVRQIKAVTKNYGEQPDPEHWKCPGCGQQARVCSRRDGGEERASLLARAIARVNCALYQREQIDPAHPGWPVAFPLSMLATIPLPASWRSVPPPQKGADPQ